MPQSDVKESRSAGGRPFDVIHARIEADEFQHAALTSSPPTCTNCSSPKASATSFHSASTTVYVKLFVGSSCPQGGSAHISPQGSWPPHTVISRSLCSCAQPAKPFHA